MVLLNNNIIHIRSYIMMFQNISFIISGNYLFHLMEIEIIFFPLPIPFSF